MIGRYATWSTRYAGLSLLFFVAMILSPLSGAGEPLTFTVERFAVDGNSLLEIERIDAKLRQYIGAAKTIEDVEAARAALEQLYHSAGYPAVLVFIPEQTTETGVIRLQVVESRVGRVRITGNRFFAKEKIMRELPSLSPDELIYLPAVQADLTRANRNPNFKVAPVMMPGREPGTIDVELKVQDKLPLHGRVELNNRSTSSTSDLRLSARVSYDNLWQRDHSVALQYQTSPQETDEVKVFVASYSLPAPWDTDDYLAIYSVVSDSNTVSPVGAGGSAQVIGEGEIYGLRYVVSLPTYEEYNHNVTFGVDYKNFRETQGDEIQPSVRYLPLSLSYAATLPDAGGVTRFDAGFNLALRRLVTDQGEFEEKRFRARGNYLYFTAGVERVQKLPFGLSLTGTGQGQLANEPLISNEQYSAGGVDSVRGYPEVTVLGDNAGRLSIELQGPDLTQIVGLWDDHLDLHPFLFYDAARTKTKSPLPGQDAIEELRGTGAGLRGRLWDGLQFTVDVARAQARVESASGYVAEPGDMRIHFSALYDF
ncbi:MAG: ShlB/FhaC/HecB family hemolysin secretion/activation protein [Nitrospirota bacterium]|jgi:hemolysin activation/secretion protein